MFLVREHSNVYREGGRFRDAPKGIGPIRFWGFVPLALFHCVEVVFPLCSFLEIITRPFRRSPGTAATIIVARFAVRLQAAQLVELIKFIDDVV